MTAQLAHLPEPPQVVPVPLTWILDPELRPADLGTLLRIAALHLQHDTLTVDQIGNGTAGEHAVRSAIANLVRLGYLDRSRVRNTGQFRGVVYRITRPD